MATGFRFSKSTSYPFNKWLLILEGVNKDKLEALEATLNKDILLYGTGNIKYQVTCALEPLEGNECQVIVLKQMT
jgi:hypothetical protein